MAFVSDKIPPRIACSNSVLLGAAGSRVGLAVMVMVLSGWMT